MRKAPNKLLTDAKSGGSAVARASFDRPGGKHGKQGKSANRSNRRNTRQSLKQGDW